MSTEPRIRCWAQLLQSGRYLGRATLELSDGTPVHLKCSQPKETAQQAELGAARMVELRLLGKPY